MSVLQAALIALCYAFARSSFNFGLGPLVLSQPLVAGTIAGLLLGAPLEGAALGGAINIAILGLSQLRFLGGPDIALIGYVGIPILLLNGIKADAEGVTLLLALAAIGIVLNFLKGMFNSLLAHWVDFFAERGDVFTTVFASIVPAQLWLFVISFLPAFFLLRLAPSSVLDLARALPAWVQAGLVMTEHALALLGIAMTMKAILQGSSIAYFVLGWLVASAAQTSATVGGAQALSASSAGVPLLVLLIGASIATIHAYVARRTVGGNPELTVQQANAESESKNSAAMSPTPARLTANDLTSSFMLWLFFSGASLNFERGQNMGLADALAPLASRLYATAEARAACLRRQLGLFVTEFSVGSFAVGAAAALEERRAKGEPVSESEFIGAKMGAMAATSAIGDAIVLGVITTLFVAIGSALARQNSLLGPFVFVVGESAAVLGIAYVSFRFGYSQLNRWSNWAEANEWLRAGFFGALRLGAFVLGALIVAITRITPLPAALSPVIQIDAARIPLQAILDGILPGLIPLGVALGMWYLMRFRNAQPMTLMGASIIGALTIAVGLRVLGWL